MKQITVNTTNESLIVKENTKVPHLAMTPPKCWNTWSSYGINVNENDVKTVADFLVSSGLKELGFEYVSIDAGWQYMLANENDYFEKNQNGSYSRHSDGTIVRNTDGVIIPDATKFPNGMKAVADYIHSLGLKAGIYTSPGNLDCVNSMGAKGFEQIDADTFADWGFDMLKYDLCSWGPYGVAPPYFKMAKCLQNTGRDFLFYLCIFKLGECWKWGGKVGHYWRMCMDRNGLFDTHDPGMENRPNALDCYEIGLEYVRYNRPNGWNEVDNIIVCLSDGITDRKTDNELQSQIALYSFINAPITYEGAIGQMVVDRTPIIANPYLMSIDNDSSHCVERVHHTESLDILVKELKDGVAILFLNKSGSTYTYSGNMLEYLSEYMGNDYIIYDALNNGNEVGALGDSVNITLPTHKSCVYIIK